MRVLTLIAALVIASWAVLIGALWVVIHVSPWVPVAVLDALIIIAIEPHRLVGR